MKLRPYQKTALDRVNKTLSTFGICYLAGEVRTGKTLVALKASEDFDTLFVTKKSAIPDIEQQAQDAGKLNIDVVNYESLHKVEIRQYKFIILDEAHCLGQFPKPARKVKALKESIAGQPVLYLSGTPSPESHSQLYHQLFVSGKGPWTRYPNFYKWAHDYVDIRKQYIAGGRMINDYSHARERVMIEFKPFRVTMTQEEAGFDGTVQEEIHWLELPPNCQDLIRVLNRDRVSGEYLADTGAKKMSMAHQISSGTAISVEGKGNIVSTFKVAYIQEKFRGRKIAIFYCYVAEGALLEKAFGDKVTRNPEEFNRSSDKVFITQVVSGREGINLSTADDLVFLNIGYSATSYFQARARSQSLKGGNKKVHWIFSMQGIEKDIYETVKGKKNYTLRHYRNGNPSEDHKEIPRGRLSGSKIKSR